MGCPTKLDILFQSLKYDVIQYRIGTFISCTQHEAEKSPTGVAMNTLKDVLVAYATSKGQLSHSSLDVGSIYVDSFIFSVCNSALALDLEQILDYTRDLVKLRIAAINDNPERINQLDLQEPCYEPFNFIKILTFNPGKSE